MGRMERRSSGPTYKVIFYRTAQGAEPVREWLQSLEKPERFQLGKAIQVLQMNGPALSMPYACRLGGGLFELRERIGKSAIACSMDLTVDGLSSCCMPR
jgi:phage-related protein